MANRCVALLLLTVCVPAMGAPAAVEYRGLATSADKTRLTLSVSDPVAHQIFTLDSPDRVVIDIPDATLVNNLPRTEAGEPTLAKVRSGVRNENDLRIVLDLKHRVRVKSFLSGADGGGLQNLIVDLIPDRGGESRGMFGGRQARATSRSAGATPRDRVAIIAIDAGHGGEDPGALGPGGTREKDVTLAIARKLAKLVALEPGMRPVMIRDGDYYLGLRERIQEARKQSADLFISIHADAYNNPEAVGSSVYMLSQGGASSEAATWLANRENSADRIGGVALAKGDESLVTLLIDMAQNATFEHSREAAKAVLEHLGQVGTVHRDQVQQAGFVVLKSPDIPSMLVETAFISNQGEERRLRSTGHQQQLAQAMLAGIRSYFSKYPPQGLMSAAAEPEGAERPAAMSAQTPVVNAANSAEDGKKVREYVIGEGDTLSDIAKRYRVSIGSLRARNGLEEKDYIRVGQVIAIPAGS